MKKIFCVILAVLCLSGLVSCSSEGNPEMSGQQNDSKSESNAAEYTLPEGFTLLKDASQYENYLTSIFSGRYHPITKFPDETEVLKDIIDKPIEFVEDAYVGTQVKITYKEEDFYCIYDYTSEGIRYYEYSEEYEDTDDSLTISIRVDAKSGEWIRAYISDSDKGSVSTLTQDECVEIAKEFVETHNLFDLEEYTCIPPRNLQSFPVGVTFRRIVNGIILNDEAYVGIDAESGVVVRYSATNLGGAATFIPPDEEEMNQIRETVLHKIAEVYAPYMDEYIISYKIGDCYVEDFIGTGAAEYILQTEVYMISIADPTKMDRESFKVIVN